MQTAYLSFDIETDGPSPIINSMLSFGICLINEYQVILDELEVNIFEREGCVQNNATMQFWTQNKKAWELCHQNQVSPQEAMEKLARFYDKWSKVYKLIWIAMPVCFDWMFLKSYYSAFSHPNAIDIGFKATCISTLRDYSIKTKVITNKEYGDIMQSVPSGLHHRSIDDARVQGFIFIKLLNFLKEKNKEKFFYNKLS
jgi:DNA polymerase III alpha subunit (gram-positive type)